MKQLTEKNRKMGAIIIASLIIVIGIIVAIVIGFNKELKYDESQKIDIYIEQQFDVSKIKEIANEVLGRRNVVETVEVYEDMISIRAKTITQEQKDNIVNKVKEIYEFKQTAENTVIEIIPAVRITDMYKQYIIPFIITGIIVLIYMLIRYYKSGIVKIIAETILIPVVAELLLLSIIAITRIPVGRFIPILVIAMYIASVTYIVKINEK